MGIMKLFNFNPFYSFKNGFRWRVLMRLDFSGVMNVPCGKPLQPGIKGCQRLPRPRHAGTRQIFIIEVY